ncbi:transmembrane 4 L6 family member 1-like [Cheilinus undulatus]|uniref:transmembrane 4 L6 family member 1-like n=1 Tax=Cheilinus undulatus TaxID=241271 RepID=UPI001BD41652|nr:transmembrane 4 L6 family member 1-like [Cheilinus undulatus]
MCTGKCSHCIAVSLYPSVLISIACNILLFFPSWDNKYAKDGNLTVEVKYMGGVLGGGILVLITALYINLIGAKGCCGNRLWMLVSIFFALGGAAGGMYSFIVAFLGLKNGPFCKNAGTWSTPFIDSNWTYLIDSQSWEKCTEPPNVVRFNAGLFMTLMVISSLQVLLCAIQVINGLLGCLCGTCSRKEEV